MKKTVGTFLCLVVALTGFVHVAHGGQQIRFAPVQRSMPMPPLRKKEGWLSITNRDWQNYIIEITRDKIFLHRTRAPGRHGTLIPSGTTVTIAIEKDNYDMYGETSDRLRVRVREGRTTTVSLEPFGFQNNSGLIGIANDGERVRKETLIDTYSSPVIVPAPPPVVIERPAPPPVIIHRPPPVVHRPPPVIHRPPPPPPVVHRPPPPGHRPPPSAGNRPPPHRPAPPPHRNNDGFGFFFGSGNSGKR